MSAYAETRAETAADLHWARSMGVHGFPTVLVRDDRGFTLLTDGYRPIEALEGPLARLHLRHELIRLREGRRGRWLIMVVKEPLNCSATSAAIITCRAAPPTVIQYRLK